VQRALVLTHGLNGAAGWRGGPQGDRSADHLDGFHLIDIESQTDLEKVAYVVER
jgi:hypothetical protein